MERKTNHCVYNINYHTVFCPKYRHRVILGKVEEVIKSSVLEICDTYGYTLIQMEVMPDHLHIFLSAPPTVAPTQIVRCLKSITANRVFTAFPNLKKKYFWGSGLWSRGYYVGAAGNVSVKTICRYIEAQKSSRKGGEKRMSKLKRDTVAKKGKRQKQGDVLVEKLPLRLKPHEEELARSIQRESARVWNTVMTIHRLFWFKYGIWIDEAMMKEFLKGRFGVHSQDVQAIVETYYECWERTKKLHEEGHAEWRYPWRRKRFFTSTWKVTGIAVEGNCLRLSNGRGKPPLRIKLPVRLKGLEIKQVQLVWHRNGYWLHVAVVKPALKKVQGDAVAAIDPGEVHALTLTDGQDALVISGRYLRSLHRLRNKTLRKFQKAISRAKKGSNRRKKLLAAKYRFLNWIESQIFHTEHAITKKTVDWCLERGVKKVYYGDPQSVRDQDCGPHHNQRMGQWSFGRLYDLLEYKLERHGISLEKIEERGTSGTCPVCGKYTKQFGRVYRCGNRECGFSGVHRDVVGAAGILDLAVNGQFTPGRRLPETVMYSRPVLIASTQGHKKNKAA